MNAVQETASRERRDSVVPGNDQQNEVFQVAAFGSPWESTLDLFRPLNRLIEQTTPRLIEGKRDLFLASVIAKLGETLSEFLTGSSDVARQCSNGAWISLEPLWKDCRFNYAVVARLAGVFASVQSPEMRSPGTIERLQKDLWWIAENGTPKEILPWIIRFRSSLASDSEFAPRFDSIIAKIQERDRTRQSAIPPSGDCPSPSVDCSIAPDVERAVNFYILAYLGVALVPDFSLAYKHNSSFFIPVFHKRSKKLEGVVEVRDEGEKIVWYDKRNSQTHEERLIFPCSDADQRQETFSIRTDGTEPQWEPFQSPPNQ